MSEEKEKKFVSVPAHLVKRVKKVAWDQGESIGSFLEKSLKQNLRTHQLGYSPQQVAEILEMLHAQKVLGGAFIPLEVLHRLEDMAYQDEREKKALQEAWYQSGKLHGRYLEEKFGEPIQTLKKFLETTRWDLNEVELEREEGTVKLRCISTVLTEQGTQLLSRFIQGVMDSMGYCTEENDCMKGMIISKFKPPQDP
ncbi:MAG: hypothetical protein ACOC6G_02515 [Thermoproteota archaeon]